MLPSKEGKEIVYRLLNDKLVSVREVSRTGDFAPRSTFYLFYVDLVSVARNLLAASRKV